LCGKRLAALLPLLVERTGLGVIAGQHREVIELQ
jgi:hypothetical protein